MIFYRHICWSPYCLGAILNVGHIHGSKGIWILPSLLCVKLLSCFLYSIPIAVLLCVIGDRYKKSNQYCLITYTCRTFLFGLWCVSCYSDFICNCGGIVRYSYQQNVESAVMIFFLQKLLCSFQMPDQCFV